jgi:hypothetical protein
MDGCSFVPSYLMTSVARLSPRMISTVGTTATGAGVIVTAWPGFEARGAEAY